MKKHLLLFGFTFIVYLLIASTAQAQSPSFVFDFFQCDPVACVQETPPTFLGAVEVTFTSTCTNSDISGVPGIDGFAEAHVGSLGGCSKLYIAHAEIDTSGTELLDDCGQPYFVDRVAEISEIFSGDGSLVVLHRRAEQSCDGSSTGVISFGEIPC